MTALEWDDDRARAWLLRTAADFIIDGGLEDEAQELIDAATCSSEARDNELGFRLLLAIALCWSAEDIDEAAAEVYGKAPVDEATGVRLTAEELDAAIECLRDHDAADVLGKDGTSALVKLRAARGSR